MEPDSIKKSLNVDCLLEYLSSITGNSFTEDKLKIVEKYLKRIIDREEYIKRN